MPIYEYRCRQCGCQDNLLESFTAAKTKKCPSCGKKTFVRLVSAAAFHLKGGGWYETDFKGKKPADKTDAPDKTDKTDKGGEGKKAADGDKKPADKTTAADKPAVKSGKDDKGGKKAARD